MSHRGCKRFSLLLHTLDERELTVAELQFLELHRANCVRCAQLEDAQGASLAALRQSDLDAEPSAAFDAVLLERLRQKPWKRTVGYWSPAVFGAAVAAVLALFTIDLLTSTAQSPSFRKPFGEARRIVPVHEIDLGNGSSIPLSR